MAVMEIFYRHLRFVLLKREEMLWIFFKNTFSNSNTEKWINANNEQSSSEIIKYQQVNKTMSGVDSEQMIIGILWILSAGDF